MNFTFGVITDGNNDGLLTRLHESIINQNITSDFEVIIVGGAELNLKNTRVISFDEEIKPSWITKKKNIIAQQSKYDNICLMHDYFYLNRGWYKNFLKFGSAWDVCMNPIINTDGQRFRDWITWPDWCKEREMIFLDYQDHSRTEEMYISGSYFCVKKQFLLKNALNEDLCWGQSEDVEWCKRIRRSWNYKCNPNSTVSLLKHKYNPHWYSFSNLKMRESWARKIKQQ